MIGMQSNYADLGRAIQPEWNTHRANAAIDVKQQIMQTEPSLNIPSTEGGKIERAKDGEANLAAMSVAGKHEAYGRPCGMVEEVVGPVGRMAKQNDGLIRNEAYGFGDGLVGIRNAF